MKRVIEEKLNPHSMKYVDDPSLIFRILDSLDVAV